jgi:2-hydroxychromene-2-carboxylate isomerase
MSQTIPAQPIKQIDFYFDFPSPYSYLASTQLPKLAEQHGVSIAYRPFRILEAMKIVGNRPTTIESKAKGKYAGADLARWVRRYGVPFERNPNRGKFDWALLGQIVLAANEQGRGQACANAIFPAVWASTDDIGDKAVLARKLDAVGFAGAALIAQASSVDYATRLNDATSKAAERGVFGAPTVFVGDDQFFGNDRLDFVAEALTATRKAA